MKKKAYANWWFMYVPLGFYLYQVFCSRNYSGIPVYLGFLLLFGLVLHLVVFAPVGIFVKYELDRSSVTVYDCLRKTKQVYCFDDSKIYKYKYILTFLVMSGDEINNKADAIKKLKEGSVSFVALWGDARSGLRQYEKEAHSLQ